MADEDEERTPTVLKEFQIGLHDPAEADLEHSWNFCSAGFLGERLYVHSLLARAACSGCRWGGRTHMKFGAQSEEKRETHPSPVATFCLPAILATRHRRFYVYRVFICTEHL